MSYELVLESSAERKLLKLPDKVLLRIDAKLLLLTEQPRPTGVRKLVGQEGLGYRLRVGKYRILYAVDDIARRVTVYDIDNRDSVY
ncbi:type II toxin-antitoxin system RelE/ParE family toxin [bacterium]|nr:type II toxin-antitoxin system RelE/ParE family toxin [bacterium]